MTIHGGHTYRSDHLNHHRHTHRHTHDHGADMRELLELDAAVTGIYLDEAIGLIRDTATRPARVIIDAGAGTGVGTRALAAAFPDAEIIAVDASAEMTAHIERSGLSNARTVTADLGAGWPASLGDADVVWASASLHHLADPAAFLRAVHRHLRPGGILAVIEMPHQPHFPGLGLDDRIEAIMRDRGANSFPDWSETITAAGFEMRGTYPVVIDTPEPTDPIRRYARAWFTRVRASLADQLCADDLATIDVLLGDGPESLHHRDDLAVHAARTIAIATIPAS